MDGLENSLLLLSITVLNRAKILSIPDILFCNSKLLSLCLHIDTDAC